MPLFTMNTSLPDDSRLPLRYNWAEALPNLTGIVEWTTFHAGFVTLDGSNKISEVTSRLSAGSGFANDEVAERPGYSSAGLYAGPSANFTGTEKLDWQGTMPVGDFTKFVIYQTPTNDEAQMDLLSNNEVSEKHQLLVASGDQLRSNVGSTNEARATTTSRNDPLQPNMLMNGYTNATGSNTLQYNSEVVNTTLAASSHGQGTLYLGATDDNMSGAFVGEIAAVVIFDIDVYGAGNEDQLAAMLAYANQVFGIAVS